MLVLKEKKYVGISSSWDTCGCFSFILENVPQLLENHLIFSDELLFVIFLFQKN